MSIQAVIFDRDNTLMRFDPQAVASLEGQIASIAPQLPDHAVLDLWQHWPGSWPQHPKDEPAFWQAFWGTLAVQHKLNTAQEQALSTIGAFYQTCFVAFPDALPCLQALKTQGLRLAVLTNFELPSVARTLEYVGIDPALFDVTLSSTTLGLRKPDPRAFAAVARELDVPRSACVFVDDLAEHVQAARTSEMRAFLLDRTRTSSDFEAGVLSSLTALPAWCMRLQPGS